MSREITDLLKYLCCWVIAFHHYSQYEIAHDLTSNPILKLFSYCGGYIGVAVFFFLSGYGLMKSDQNAPLQFWKFIKKRLLKVYVPIVYVAILWLLIDSALRGLHPDILDGVMSILLCENHLWFVRVILLLYVVFILCRIVDRLYMNNILSLSLLILLSCVCMLLAGMTMGGLASISIPFFVIGIMSAALPLKPVMAVRGGVILLFYILLLAFYLLSKIYRTGYTEFIILNVMVVLAILLFNMFYRVNIKCNETVKSIMVTSYDVYLTHMIALTSISMYVSDIPLLFFLALTFILSLVFYRLRTLV